MELKQFGRIPVSIPVILMIAFSCQSGKKGTPTLIDDYGTADRLLQHLADQKYTVDSIMTFAENVKEDDPNVASTIEDVLARESSEEEIKGNLGCLGLLIRYKNYAKKKVKLQM